MITRPFGDGGWSAACWAAPPPLHVYDTESEAANWHPLTRPRLFPQHPGPTIVQIPVVAPFGDDPSNPTACTEPRHATAGMVARLNTAEGARLEAALNVREVV